MCYLCAFIDIELRKLGFLGHHALRCVIDGPRVEYRTPLSLRNDKEGGCAHISCKYTAMPLVVLCCSKTGVWQIFWSADQ